MKVGVVGIGNLGRAITEAFASAGHEVVAFDVDASAADGLDVLGITVADGLRAVATCEVVCILVRDDQQVIEVVGSLLPECASDTVLVVMPTVHPRTIDEVGAMADAAGVALVDAPFMGQGVISIERRDAVVPVGDTGALFERIRPLMEVFASTVLPVGARGSGATLKLGHNVVVYLGYQTIMEGRELMRLAGVEPGMLERVTAATGALPAQAAMFLDARAPDPDDLAAVERMRIFAAIHDKDIRHAVALAREFGGELPLTEQLQGRGEEIFAIPS